MPLPSDGGAAGPVLRPAVVRIRSLDGAVSGAGFLVAPDTILTCAHVVADPNDSLPVDFPFLQAGAEVEARVARWLPVRQDERGDIAVLKLSGPLPRGAHPLRLVAASDLWRHDTRVFGYPDGNDHGKWVAGELRDQQALGWVQMESQDGGPHITRGFSGAPVWDEQVGGVVGMTVAAERGRTTAYLIPSETLRAEVPDLLGPLQPPCPYRGLESFRTEDAPVFHGRDQEAARLLAATLRHSIVVVAGPSGSGKSSLVYAGLLPALHRQGVRTITLRPGDQLPEQLLAHAFVPVLEPDTGEPERVTRAEELAEELAEDLAGGNWASVAARLVGSTEGLMLIVDQYEELAAKDPARARALLAIITELAAAGDAVRPRSFRAVLTLRSAALDGLLTTQTAEMLEHATVLVPPMGDEQLAAAIARPAADSGLLFQDGLVERIVEEANESAAQLPLVEFAMTKLWDHQRNGRLTHDSYNELGGVAGALAAHAERVFQEELSPSEQDRAHRLFVQLARPDESGSFISQPADVDRLTPTLVDIAQRLAAAPNRLLVIRHDQGQPWVVALAHETLIRNWRRLRGWLNAKRDFRAWQEELRFDLERQQPLTQARLETAESWLASHRADIGVAERAFITANRRAVLNSLRRRQLLTAALATLLVVAVGFAVAYRTLSSDVRNQRDLAESRQLAAQSETIGTTDSTTAAQLAAAAWRIADTPEAHNSMRSAAQNSSRGALAGHTDVVKAVAFSPGGRVFATGGADTTARLWDTRTRRQIGAPITGHAGAVLGVAFSSDGKTLATASTDNTARLWNVATRRQVGGALTGHKRAVTGVAFSRDGTTLATASTDKTVRLWKTKNHRQTGKPLVAHTVAVVGVAFNSDGKTLATVSEDKTVRLWETGTRRQLGAPLVGHTGAVTGAAFSSDGKTLATVSDDKTVRLWDFTIHRQLGEPYTGHKSAVVGVAFSPGGKTLATIGTDDTTRLWDVKTHRPSGEPLESHARPSPGGAHDSTVSRVAFSPNGKLLATASSDNTVRLWDVGRRKQIGDPLTGHRGGVTGVAFSPDGKTVATTSMDGTARLWRVDNHQQRGDPLTGHSESVFALAFSPDSKAVATASADGTVLLWDARTQRQIGSPFIGHARAVFAVAFSPDGKMLATTSTDSTVRLWKVATHQQSGTSFGNHRNSWGAAFSPDGSTLATTSTDNTVRLWDVATHRQIGDPLIDHSRSVLGVAFSPNGNMLATVGNDKTVRLWGVDMPKDLFATNCVIAGRSLTRAEWKYYVPNVEFRKVCPSG